MYKLQGKASAGIYHKKENCKQVRNQLLLFERCFQGSLNVVFDAAAGASFYCLFYVLMQFIRDGNICQRNHHN